MLVYAAFGAALEISTVPLRGVTYAVTVAVDYRPGSGIRVGPHFFSTEDECHAVLAEMATIRDGH